MVRKLTIKDMHKLAKDSNIKFMSKEYEGCMKKHKWKCNKCNNTWYVSPNNIQQGRGCPMCAIEKRKQKCFDKMIKITKLQRKKDIINCNKQGKKNIQLI
jgi:hypothetical protein